MKRRYPKPLATSKKAIAHTEAYYRMMDPDAGTKRDAFVHACIDELVKEAFAETFARAFVKAFALELAEAYVLESDAIEFAKAFASSAIRGSIRA